MLCQVRCQLLLAHSCTPVVVLCVADRHVALAGDCDWTVCTCSGVIATRESDGCSSHKLTDLLHRYLRLDNEMLEVAVQWRDCFQLIVQYNDEQVRDW